jgi:hypothetical protein
MPGALRGCPPATSTPNRRRNPCLYHPPVARTDLQIRINHGFKLRKRGSLTRTAPNQAGAVSPRNANAAVPSQTPTAGRSPSARLQHVLSSVVGRAAPGGRTVPHGAAPVTNAGEKE